MINKLVIYTLFFSFYTCFLQSKNNFIKKELGIDNKLIIIDLEDGLKSHNDSIKALKKRHSSYSSINCVENIILNTPEMNTTFLYEATNYINVESNYRVDSNANITMKAGKSIVLKSNTVIYKDSRFLGRIESCKIDNCAQDDLVVYDKFFSPNNDGKNDYWNIKGLENQPQATIYIFNRQGKLIRQLSPNEKGWDGTYNSRPVLSSDYWFKVLYLDCNGLPKELKSNFSLLR